MKYLPLKLSPWEFFCATFTDPNGVPDHNRLTVFAALAVLIIYVPISLFKTKLGLDYMPNELLGAFVSIVVVGQGFTSRETVNKINQNKPDAPAAVNIAATTSGDALNSGPSGFNPN